MYKWYKEFRETHPTMSSLISFLKGLLIGLIEVFWSGYISIEYKDIAAFTVLVVVLIFYPTGFLGKPDIEKV